MRKIFAFFALIFIFGSLSFAYASPGFFKTDSRLYFLQPALESIRLIFIFSGEGRADYLLELTDRRVDEISEKPSVASAARYQKHFEELEKLVNNLKKKELVAEKIEEANLRQQAILAAVYTQVPDEAKDAILNAQENSSKNVVGAIEAAGGADKAQEYIQRVEQIQRSQKMERAERMERAAMEGSPNVNPSEGVPRGLKGGRELLPAKELNPLNPVFDEQGGSGGERMEPAPPVEMQQPAPRQ